jgi:GT2 family glycosyltransferase
MASIKQYEVVIVTYKRPGDLFEVLTNLSEQTLKPSVVNIVDNDLEGSAKKIVELFQLERGMRLNYLINSTNSLTQGRNLGISIVSSPFVGLLDDDIIIPADYFEKSVNFLQANSDVAGVQG